MMVRPAVGLSRACAIAGSMAVRMAQDVTQRERVALAHACCEGKPCTCPCHKGMTAYFGRPGDPVPVVDQ